jgi:hypothetical protein
MKKHQPLPPVTHVMSLALAARSYISLSEDAYALSSNPTSIVGAEKNCRSGNILRFSYSTQSFSTSDAR